MHKPLGKYIFNNIAFSRYDPLVETLRAANYNVFNHPYDDSSILVTFPVKNDGVDFAIIDGKEVNQDSALSQLEVYKMLMESYCQQNVSCTISYSLEETDEIVNWLYHNWNSYVAVSFLFRNDASKTAADLGHPYLPQEVTTKELYEAYVYRLLPIDLEKNNSFEELGMDDCSTGACPIR
jgi:ribonucleoside-triphosphate reductase